MPKSRIIVVLGALIALLPVLGFPRDWEVFFQILSGLSIVLLSVWSQIDRKLMLKAKARERMGRKSPEPNAAPGMNNNIPVREPGESQAAYGKRVTDFYPKTAPPGRRLTDIKPTLNPDEQQY